MPPSPALMIAWIPENESTMRDCRSVMREGSERVSLATLRKNRDQRPGQARCWIPSGMRLSLDADKFSQIKGRKARNTKR